MQKKITHSKTFKVASIIVGASIIIFIILLILYRLYCKENFTNTEISFFIGSTKDIFQIVFFIIVALITIFSYIQAKKTLFTPIKTETFKMQIKAFEEILAFFQTKTETDFTQQFDFDFIFHANCRLMLNDYIETFFKGKIKINEESMKELQKDFAGGLVSAEFAHKNFISPEYYEKTKIDKEPEITNPALILEKWKAYEYGHIFYSKKYFEESEKITQLIASPLLPITLKDKIELFDRKVKDNLFQIGKTLTTLAEELPQKLPNAKSVVQIDPAGLWNRYNKDYEYLEPTAKEILGYIRTYLKIDTLVD